MMAMSPYPGYKGEFFAMPCRNVIPKPAHKPHPPLWVAGKPDVAAKNGMGCLGFSVVSGDVAKNAVDNYYETLANECVPIGHAVNANIAMLANFHVHRDEATARQRAEHLKFFGYSVSKYYLPGGKARPGRERAWETFMKVKDDIPQLGVDNPTSAIGNPEQVRKHLRALQDAGVDQVMLMHQGGRMPHDWNCESLELFTREIMPEFRDNEDRRLNDKRVRLEPAIEAAMKRKAWMQQVEEVPVVESYGNVSFNAKNYEFKGVSDSTTGALGLVPKA